MHAPSILLAFALSALSAAQQDIDNNDIPSQCSSVCSGLVQLTQTCDNSINDDNNDRLYLNCVCNATGVITQLPLCEACVATFDDDGRDTDVNDLLISCSFPTTTYNPSSSYASTSIPASAAVTATSSTNALSVTSAANPTATSSGLSSFVSSLTATDSTGGVVPESTNAAGTMGPKGMGAGVGLGVLGVAFGLL